uniref:Uncharacterized protein n=1 Tax=Oryza punctata TaxID=4537 RepID=A0A0E0KBY6_ORYPU
KQQGTKRPQHKNTPPPPHTPSPPRFLLPRLPRLLLSFRRAPELPVSHRKRPEAELRWGREGRVLSDSSRARLRARYRPDLDLPDLSQRSKPSKRRLLLLRPRLLVGGW